MIHLFTTTEVGASGPVVIAGIAAVAAIASPAITAVIQSRSRKENQADHHTVQSQLDGLRGDVGAVKSDVSAVKSDVADVKADVRALKGDVAELETRKVDLLLRHDAERDTEGKRYGPTDEEETPT